MRMLKLLFVAGTRPNFMKIAPLLRTCCKYKQIKTFLVHTGQHYDVQMSEVFFKELHIQPPDLLLESGKYADPVEQKEYIREQIYNGYKNSGIHAVVVVGDVNSTVGGALAGEKLEVPIVHIEAGLRSFDERMPEEHNRIFVDQLASIYFVTEPSGMKNLQESRFRLKSKNAYLVGNTMIDTLLYSLPEIVKLNTAKKMHLLPKQFVVLTLHRKENLEDISIVQNFLDMIEKISLRTKVVWPIHPRTENYLKEHNFYNRVVANRNIILIAPLGYFELISIVRESLCVITDSGGIQDETTVLGVPCLTIRRTTERPITTTVGSSTIVGENGAKLLRQFHRIVSKTYKKSRIPHYWDGKTSERIIKKLLETL